MFDAKLTTYAGLARLDGVGIDFITLRRRSPKLLKDIALLPRSAWRTVELDAPTRPYRTPRSYEQTVVLAGCKLRQIPLVEWSNTQALHLQRPRSRAGILGRFPFVEIQASIPRPVCRRRS